MGRAVLGAMVRRARAVRHVLMGREGHAAMVRRAKVERRVLAGREGRGAMAHRATSGLRLPVAHRAKVEHRERPEKVERRALTVPAATVRRAVLGENGRGAMERPVKGDRVNLAQGRKMQPHAPR